MASIALRNLRNRLTTPLKRRQISTTPKKKDAQITYENEFGPKTAEDFANVSKQKNWISYGFDYRSKYVDRVIAHASAFLGVTCCLIFMGTIWAYHPDRFMKNWAVREAYLELRRREAAGLEPISANYIDPAQIQLPSDEELGETEIII